MASGFQVPRGFFFFFFKKSNQRKIKGGFLEIWISWTPQNQLYIWDIQSSALNNFYSSLGNLSVQSERESQKKTNQTNKIHVVQLSKDSQNERPVETEGSARMAVLFPPLCHSLTLVFPLSMVWHVRCSEHLQRLLVEVRHFYRLTCPPWGIQLIRVHILSLE